MRTLLALVVLMLSWAGQAIAADLDATLHWSHRTELTLPVSGVITSVAVDAGQRVAKGQLLLTLDDAPFRADLQAAEAQLARRQSERNESMRDAKQAEELFERTVLSQVELENAKMKVTRAEAGFQEAKAAVERARYRLRMSSLRASFDLVVLSRHVEAGQTIAAELQPPVLLVIAAANEYLAQARVPIDRSRQLKLGQNMPVTVDGKTYEAKLKSLAYTPENGKEPYILQAVFSTPDPLSAGQAARLRLP